MWVEIRAICSVDKRISVAIADIPLLFLLFLLFSLVYVWLGVTLFKKFIEVRNG